MLHFGVTRRTVLWYGDMSTVLYSANWDLAARHTVGV